MPLPISCVNTNTKTIGPVVAEAAVEVDTIRGDAEVEEE